MLLIALTVLLGLCAAGDARRAAAGHRFLRGADEAAAAPLSSADLIIVTSTTLNRLPLVHASRPARRGIRTIIVLQNASEAAQLNELYGGTNGEHNETYLAWLDPAAARGGGASVNSGLYGRVPAAAATAHPLHAIGPAWAMAPLLAHAAVLAASSTPPSSTSAAAADNDDGDDDDSAAAATTTSSAAAAPPPPYRWMLLARDDTLWRPRQVAALLSQYDAGVAAAVSDHFQDFNGRALLAPSSAAAVCLPCGSNMTALLGRRHPPGVPQPGCPVCRPAGGCEFRFDLCGGLVGGSLCGSKRFLGSGDRCSHSWAAGGAGVALSITLLSYLDQEDWTSCIRGQRPSTGERALGRCLWRHGFSFTHPAMGLMAGRTREVFSERHMLFGNPLLRQEIFGSQADALLGPLYRAEEEAAAAKAAAAAAAAAAEAAAAAAAPSTTPMAAGFAVAAGSRGGGSAATATSLPASTRVVMRTAGAGGGGGDGAAPAAAGAAAAVAAAVQQEEEAPCDADCRRWLGASGVSVHLDVPYGDGVDVAAAAALIATAAAAQGAAT